MTAVTTPESLANAAAIKMGTARDVARLYSAEAAWVPCDRVMPPPGETVEVLYADGVVCRAALAGLSGQVFIMEGASTYRYVDPMFWRPLPDTTR